MNMVWNAMLFDRAWICTAAGSAAAAAIVAALGLLVSRVVRGRPAPLRYGLLLAALAVLGVVPAVATASRLLNWAAVQVPAALVDRPLAAAAVVAPAVLPRPQRAPAVVADAELVPSARTAETVGAPLRMPTFREAASGLLWVC